MAITINGSGTITGINVGGLPDGIVDTDMIADDAVTQAKRGAAAGTNSGILQVVQGTTSTEVTVNTTTYTDTGLSASITPSSNTSKILVLVNQQYRLGITGSTNYGGIRVYRDSTVVYEPVTDGTGPYEWACSVGGASSVNFYARAVFSILDSPASTSSLTYKTQGRPYYSSSGGAMAFNKEDSVADSTSYILLLEVAA